ncbi:unnamed protein product [Fraxinus pennsylvanica]|uniref:Uncharacterized protein n=1 Tax=Fraxinus pennsylvanica TaxID=56036 RepID=A0AAD2DY80_9LAMI|nr:unnamed protein product [Fraxinus pennsylvanica]
MDSEKLGFLENDLIQVNVSFMGKCHMVVEEILGSFGFGKVPSSEESYQNVCGSHPDRLMSKIYQYLGWRTLMGFKETPNGGNLTCSPSGPCIPCSRSENVPLNSRFNDF